MALTFATIFTKGYAETLRIFAVFRHLICVSAVLGSAHESKAIVENGTTPDSNYVAAAAPFAIPSPANNFAPTDVWLEETLLVNGNLATFYTQGVIVDPWHVLTVAHNLIGTAGSAGVVGIGFGNRLTSTNLAATASGYVINPNYVLGSSYGSTPDLAIITLATPVAGARTLSIAPVTTGEVLTGVGDGEYGFGNGTLFPTDGQFRAFQGPVMSTPETGANSAFYDGIEFDPPLAPLALSGQGAPGDSGGGVYDSKGDLIGLITGGSTGYGPTGETDISMLTQPDMYAWIVTNSFCPAPTLLIQAAGTKLILTWSGPYLLQTTTNLTGSYTDVPTATSPYTNSIASEPQLFFRLHSPTP